METSSCWYNGVMLFLGDIITGTWISRLGWDSKIWSALSRPSNSFKLETRPLAREGAPISTDSQLTEIKTSHGSQIGTRHQDRLYSLSYMFFIYLT
jgi:hypothetical protein